MWFVTRERSITDFHVTKVLTDKTKKHNAKGILKEKLITVGVKQNGKVEQRLKLRRITFLSEEGKRYIFCDQQYYFASFTDRNHL